MQSWGLESPEAKPSRRFPWQVQEIPTDLKDRAGLGRRLAYSGPAESDASREARTVADTWRGGRYPEMGRHSVQTLNPSQHQLTESEPSGREQTLWTNHEVRGTERVLSTCDIV